MGEAKRRGTYDERKRQSIENNTNLEQNSDNEGPLNNSLKQSLTAEASPRILQFVESINLSLSTKNYFSALTGALILPDICCSLEDPIRRSSGKKYVTWFRKYIEELYKTYQGEGKNDYLWFSGEECYALRCAYLHKGTNSIEDEVILKNYKTGSKKIEFMAEMFSDNLQMGDTLIIRLERFCQNIIYGVEQWLENNKDNQLVLERMLEIPRIYTESFSPMPGVYIEC